MAADWKLVMAVTPQLLTSAQWIAAAQKLSVSFCSLGTGNYSDAEQEAGVLGWPIEVRDGWLMRMVDWEIGKQNVHGAGKENLHGCGQQNLHDTGKKIHHSSGQGVLHGATQ